MNESSRPHAVCVAGVHYVGQPALQVHRICHANFATLRIQRFCESSLMNICNCPATPSAVQPVLSIRPSWPDAVFRVCRMSRPCFRAVSVTVRSGQKFSTPSSVRKHPEIFCHTFVTLRSLSASLFVNGTLRSCRKSKTADFKAWRPKARLCPVRRFGRPRFFRFNGGVRGGWFPWNVIACSQQASYRRSISLIASGATASRPSLRAVFVSFSASSRMVFLSDAHSSFANSSSASNSRTVCALHTPCSSTPSNVE